VRVGDLVRYRGYGKTAYFLVVGRDPDHLQYESGSSRNLPAFKLLWPDGVVRITFRGAETFKLIQEGQ